MQSSSIFNRSLVHAHEQTLSKRKRHDPKSSIYKTRKWRSNRPILTTNQMHELGKLLGLKTLQRSIDLFMNPANMFQLNKVKLGLIHQFLLDRGLEKRRVAVTKLNQYPIALRLFAILYPGFPVWRAKEQALKLQRESANEKRKARPGLAYDQLPTCDIFERLEELVRMDVKPIPYVLGNDDNYNNEDNPYVQKQTIAIPTKGLLDFAQAHVRTKKKDTRDVRLHLYLWLSHWRTWEPRLSELTIDSKNNQWADVDRKPVEKHGFRHIDITDKVDWRDVLDNRSGNGGKIVLEFDCNDDIKELSICTVWQKSPTELASQVYVQTAGMYIGRLVERAQSRTEVAMIQKQAFNFLSEKDDRRTNVHCSRALLNKCMDTFKASGSAAGVGGHGMVEGDDDDDDLVMCDQTISLLDPLLLKQIEYPSRGIYCSHVACFDAACLFQCLGFERSWHCPLCAVQYKSIQDLYIDHELDQAIHAYPSESKLILRDGQLYPPPEELRAEKKVKVEHIDEDEEDNDNEGDET
ncbi:hypothetical protein BDB00DRAFT_928700 [Zychaea mexicana]|uniref:uncharacterized protein n=1 Tax=Zychaea mexicana TaxID=64656 RepID=UPI0022FE365E|nr:uncharacterized protein BDB00DRAFT_928700 [Zychaea mexicana]KAI9493754.1 hypothetical protein BDB00DRAFT_928700 [Zychaea mexicana]